MKEVFLFVAVHYLFDVVLQSEKLARGKNRNSTGTMYDPKLHGPKAPCWIFDLFAHASSHGLGIYLVCVHLGVRSEIAVVLGCVETFAHGTIDFFKCEKKFGVFEDQGFHLLCKFIYILIIGNLV